MSKAGTPRCERPPQAAPDGKRLQLQWFTGASGVNIHTKCRSLTRQAPALSENSMAARALTRRSADAPGDYWIGESETVAAAETLNRITNDWSV